MAAVVGSAATIPSYAGETYAAETTVTFPLAGGSLTLSAPTSVTLNAATLAVGGTSVSGHLGTSTLSDTRGLLAHTDTVTMSSSNFADATNDTINASNASGFSGTPTITGTAVGVPTANGQPLAGAGSTILQLTGVVGSITVTYNPTISVTIPGNSIAGTYTATVTQTAA